MSPPQRADSHPLPSVREENTKISDVWNLSAVTLTTVTMKKSAVGQAELRQMMAKIKASENRGAPASRTNKKYKLSSRELALLEEEKRRKQAEAAAKPKAAPLPKDFFERKPAKSILKNSGAPSSHQPPLMPQSLKRPPPPAVQREAAVPGTESEEEPKRRKVEPKEDDDSMDTGAAAEGDTGSASLPEGFFDDPIKDAKARNVEYKDPAEEEWARFQKEISQEIEAATEMVADDREESTVDRQLEEIDDQMRAWSRVSELERKKDQVEEGVECRRKQAIKKEDDEGMEGGSDSSDVGSDFEEGLMDWRKKLS